MHTLAGGDTGGIASDEDRRLVALCVAGDPTAKRRLFERERRRVEAVLFRVLGPSPHVDDLLQEVFLHVFRGLGGFRGESQLSTWIDRCAVRTVFAHIRGERSRNRRLVGLDGLASESPSAERHALAREAVRRLCGTLEKLEPAPRMAFLLHAVDGRPIKEVAELTRATVVATKSRIFRARQYVERRARTDFVLAEYLGAQPSP